MVKIRPSNNALQTCQIVVMWQALAEGNHCPVYGDGLVSLWWINWFELLEKWNVCPASEFPNALSG